MIHDSRINSRVNLGVTVDWGLTCNCSGFTTHKCK